METNELLQQILIKLESLEAGQAKLEAGQAKLEAGQERLEAGQEKLEARQTKLEAGQAKLEASQSKLEAGQAKLEAGQAEHDRRFDQLESDVLGIKVTIENDIAKKFGALFDGHKLNDEKLDHISAVVDDIDASVSAIDVVTHFNTNEIIKLKIVK